MAAVVAVPMDEITAHLVDVRDNLLYRWRRQAQKAAVLAWRDRTVGPGVAARFTKAGQAFYHFSSRTSRYRASNGNIAPYVHTGRFRDALLKRQPTSKNTGGSDVVTKFSIDGGVLNLLGSKFGVVSETISRVQKRVHVRATQRHCKNGSFPIRDYEQTRTVEEKQLNRSPRSYREEFAITFADLSWMAQESDRIFAETVRDKAFTKTGRFRTGVREQMREAA